MTRIREEEVLTEKDLEAVLESQQTSSMKLTLSALADV